MPLVHAVLSPIGFLTVPRFSTSPPATWMLVCKTSTSALRHDRKHYPISPFCLGDLNIFSSFPSQAVLCIMSGRILDMQCVLTFAQIPSVLLHEGKVRTQDAFSDLVQRLLHRRWDAVIAEPSISNGNSVLCSLSSIPGVDCSKRLYPSSAPCKHSPVPDLAIKHVFNEYGN